MEQHFSAKTPKLLGIQSLRAIAAFLVVFQHITYYTTTAKGLDYSLFLRLDFGHIGVGLFFVISGFVMASCMNQGNSFLVQRALRIYPGYWLTIALSYLILHFSWEWHWDLTSVFLLPTKDLNNYYKIPYWTLIYEMVFYVITYCIALARGGSSRATHLCCLWLLIIFVVNSYSPIARFAPGNLIFFSMWNIFFILGMLFSLNLEAIKKIPSALLLIMSIVLWGMSLNLVGFAQCVIISTSFSLLISYSMDKLTNNYLVKLGDVSYGIYLLHVPIACCTIHVLMKSYPHISLRYLWCITLAFSLVLSTLFGLVEHEIYKRLKAKLALVLRRKIIRDTIWINTNRGVT